MLDEATKRQDSQSAGIFIAKAAGHAFYNTSAFRLQKLMGDPAGIKANLLDCFQGFSANVRDVFDRLQHPVRGVNYSVKHG